jgi:hypothetical protein
LLGRDAAGLETAPWSMQRGSKPVVAVVDSGRVRRPQRVAWFVKSTKRAVIAQVCAAG